MKVRLVDNPRYTFTTKDTVKAWLKPEREYLVLEIEVYGHGCKLRLDSPENDTPGLFDATLFEVTSPRTSSMWEITIGEFGVTLGPKSWLKPGFWDEYFERSPQALMLFEEALTFMRREESH